MMMAISALVLTAYAIGASAAPAKKPNIVWFLTDDQDQMLGGSFPITSPGAATPMPKTQKLMVEEGTMATNMFIHTPICCPSRSEVLSGRYFHNIKKVGGATCMHVDETKVNNATFAMYLQTQANYKVGMFGKCERLLPRLPPRFTVSLTPRKHRYRPQQCARLRTC
eukprot:COSAG05_NODE_8258_length_721_cov_1.800643_1_plen_166_part_01